MFLFTPDGVQFLTELLASSQRIKVNTGRNKNSFMTNITTVRVMSVQIIFPPRAFFTSEKIVAFILSDFRKGFT